MTIATVLPPTGEAFVDVRDGGRSLRVSWHADAGLFVFSMWRDGVCAATFQLDRSSAPELIASMVECLARVPDVAWTAPSYTAVPRRHRLTRRRAR